MNIITSTEAETKKFGELFAKKLSPGNVVYLYGNLGSGKTTFVKGVAVGLGITSRIISPTFVIVRKHRTGIMNHELGIKNLYHIDLYRLENERDVNGIGLKDILEDKEGVTFVEWPEQAKNYLLDTTWNVIFEHLNENARKITYQRNPVAIS